MLQRLRESLALLLIALLPFHAFLVTVVTKWVEGPGAPPMSEIAVWKEIVLAMILLMAIVEILFRIKNAEFRKFDRIDVLIIGLLLLGIVVSLFHSQFSILNSQFLFGFRYDFIPLVAFLILRRVSWSELFFTRVIQIILWTGGIIAAYGIISFFLPASFFTWLGYSDLHSLYLPDGPLAPFQQIGGTAIRRIQSVMSGPNQLGLWLLIPIGIVMSHELRVMRKITQNSRLLVLMTLVAALLLTFSRAAWIGAAVIVGNSLWPVVRSMSRRAVISLLASALCFLALVLALFPSVILRAASSRGHIENPLKAIQTMIDHPLGLGLGTAGPASNRTSDACVMLEAGSDASWAADRPDLCVFVADVQIQPVDRACHCPFLPENWYLQIGVEMGWLGLVLYLLLVWCVLQRLGRLRMQNAEFRIKTPSPQFSILNSQFLIFVGVGVAALFLHAWEDSAVACTVWVLMASLLPPSRALQTKS
jgi:hypothetical protein